MASIFICYRRDDSAGYAGRLRDSLSARLGAAQVFRDIETIGPGDDFVRAMAGAIASSEVVLVVIGKYWLGMTGPDGRRRLDDPEDHVRREIGEALDGGVRLIPVLVGGAAMPPARDLPEPLAELARRNAISLDDDGWDADVERLVTAIMPLRASRPWAAAGSYLTPYLKNRRVQYAAGIAAIVLVGAVALPMFRSRDRSQSGDLATAGSVQIQERAPVTPARGRAGSATPGLPAGGEAELGQTTFEILRAEIVPAGSTRVLTLHFRVTNNGRYAVMYGDREFRLASGEASLSPNGPVSHMVVAESARDGAIAFDLPAGSPANAVLQITSGEERAEIPLDLEGRTGLTPEAAREARRAGRTSWRATFDSGSALMRFEQIGCELQSAVVRTFANKLTLTLRLRVQNDGRYDAGFGDSQVRLRVDEVLVPPADTFNVIAGAGKTAEVDAVFDVPHGTSRVILRIRFYEQVMELPLQLTRDSAAG